MDSNCSPTPNEDTKINVTHQTNENIFKNYLNNHPSSPTDLSNNGFQDVKVENQDCDVSGDEVTNIPKSEQKIIDNDPDLLKVILVLALYTL